MANIGSMALSNFRPRFPGGSPWLFRSMAMVGGHGTLTENQLQPFYKMVMVVGGHGILTENRLRPFLHNAHGGRPRNLGRESVMAMLENGHGRLPRNLGRKSAMGTLTILAMKATR